MSLVRIWRVEFEGKNVEMKSVWDANVMVRYVVAPSAAAALKKAQEQEDPIDTRVSSVRLEAEAWDD